MGRIVRTVRKLAGAGAAAFHAQRRGRAGPSECSFGLPASVSSRGRHRCIRPALQKSTRAGSPSGGDRALSNSVATPGQAAVPDEAVGACSRSCRTSKPVPRSSDDAQSDSQRPGRCAAEFAQKEELGAPPARSLRDERDHRAADRGVIATDGKRSCAGANRGDRIATNAIIGLCRAAPSRWRPNAARRCASDLAEHAVRNAGGGGLRAPGRRRGLAGSAASIGATVRGGQLTGSGLRLVGRGRCRTGLRVSG